MDIKKIIVGFLLPLVLILFAGYGYIKQIEGWGWLLFAALLLGTDSISFLGSSGNKDAK